MDNLAMDSLMVWLIAGLILMLFDLLLIGGGILFLVGSSAIIVSLFVEVQWIAHDLSAMLLLFIVTNALLFLLLWKPLKRLQKEVDRPEEDGTVTGYQFILSEDLIPDSETNHDYMGIVWTILLEEGEQRLEQGEPVKVTRASVGKLWVKSAHK
jgi:inner membrane protein